MAFNNQKLSVDSNDVESWSFWAKSEQLLFLINNIPKRKDVENTNGGGFSAIQSRKRSIMYDWNRNKARISRTLGLVLIKNYTCRIITHICSEYIKILNFSSVSCKTHPTWIVRWSQRIMKWIRPFPVFNIFFDLDYSHNSQPVQYLNWSPI